MSPANNQLLYYRIYNKDNALPTKRPAYLDNIYLGRIKTEWVSPPQNARSLRLCLCAMENVDPDKTVLYTSPYSKNPTADDTPMALNSNQTPGIVAEEPLLLLSEVLPKDGIKEGTQSLFVSPDARSPLEPLFLYYGVYTEDGTSVSKDPVNPDEPWISKINLDLMPPPPFVATLIRIIAAKEDVKGFAEIFTDNRSATPLSNADSIVADNGQWLGSTPGDHVSFIYNTRTKIPSFVEGTQYRILNRLTERALILNNGVVSGRDLYLFDPKVNAAGTTATYQGKYLEFTLKRRDDGGVALLATKSGQWVGLNLMNSSTEQSFYLISSNSNENFFFICTDRDHRQALFDPQGSDVTGYGAFRVEIGNLNADDSKHMWRLLAV